LGYHLAEHHGTPVGLAPSPNIFLSVAAQRTRRIRLGPRCGPARTESRSGSVGQGAPHVEQNPGPGTTMMTIEASATSSTCPIEIITYLSFRCRPLTSALGTWSATVDLRCNFGPSPGGNLLELFTGRRHRHRRAHAEPNDRQTGCVTSTR
jgi:hypothetical protein